MAKGANQKLKLLYLTKIFQEKTDDDHGITMPEIIESLATYDVNAERKSIYDDMEQLRRFGVSIDARKQNGKTYYYMDKRLFEQAELKLLVDAVQSSKFITAKKSQELIKKLESLASHEEAKKLQRQVYVTQRIKTMNESIYYNVDAIHEAIFHNCDISFQYFQWNTRKEMELRRGGKRYQVSPWALSWTDENYYMIAYDAQEEIIKHFRVDKMLRIEREEQARQGKEAFASFDMGMYTKKRFGMFHGNEETVTLQCKKELAGVMIDRFGKDVSMRPDGEDGCLVRINVIFSQQFIGWLIGLGSGVQVAAPLHLREEVSQKLKEIQKLYE